MSDFGERPQEAKDFSFNQPKILSAKEIIDNPETKQEMIEAIKNGVNEQLDNLAKRLKETKGFEDVGDIIDQSLSQDIKTTNNAIFRFRDTDKENIETGNEGGYADRRNNAAIINLKGEYLTGEKNTALLIAISTHELAHLAERDAQEKLMGHEYALGWLVLFLSKKFAEEFKNLDNKEKEIVDNLLKNSDPSLRGTNLDFELEDWRRENMFKAIAKAYEEYLIDRFSLTTVNGMIKKLPKMLIANDITPEYAIDIETDANAQFNDPKMKKNQGLRSGYAAMHFEADFLKALFIKENNMNPEDIEEIDFLLTTANFFACDNPRSLIDNNPSDLEKHFREKISNKLNEEISDKTKNKKYLALIHFMAAAASKIS